MYDNRLLEVQASRLKEAAENKGWEVRGYGYNTTAKLSPFWEVCFDTGALMSAELLAAWERECKENKIHIYLEAGCMRSLNYKDAMLAVSVLPANPQTHNRIDV